MSQPKNHSIPTIFDIDLNSDLEKGQLAPKDKELAADAFLMFLAATDTTGIKLVFAIGIH